MKRNSIVFFSLIVLAVIAGSAVAGTNVPVNQNQVLMNQSATAGVQDELALSMDTSVIASPAGRYTTPLSGVDQPAAADRRVWHNRDATSTKSYRLLSNVGVDGNPREIVNTRPAGGPVMGISTSANGGA